MKSIDNILTTLGSLSESKKLFKLVTSGNICISNVLLTINSLPIYTFPCSLLKNEIPFLNSLTKPVV